MTSWAFAAASTAYATIMLVWFLGLRRIIPEGSGRLTCFALLSGIGVFWAGAYATGDARAFGLGLATTAIVTWGVRPRGHW